MTAPTPATNYEVSVLREHLERYRSVTLQTLDRFAHCLHARALREVWFPWPVGPALEQVGRLCDECHPVADALTDRPPLRRVRMRPQLG